jgi:hypothetical protein
MNRQLIRCLLFMICISIFLGCEKKQITNNAELQTMADLDQQDRSEDGDEPLEPKDEIRRKRVFELLAANAVRTPKDKVNSALILQHTGMVFVEGELKSKSVENHYLAHQLAKSAFESGYEEARFFTAVTYDRYSWMAFGYQKYGTQTTFVNHEEVWVTIDSVTSDEERAVYNVLPLDELLKQKPMQ